VVGGFAFLMLIKVETINPSVKIKMTEYCLARDSGFQLGSEGSIFTFTPQSLFDMLSKYAFSFYEIVIQLERLRNIASVFAGGIYAASPKVSESDRVKLLDSLATMLKECEILGLNATSDLVPFIESGSKGENYCYNDL
jgi:hypothetical protein